MCNVESFKSGRGIDSVGVGGRKSWASLTGAQLVNTFDVRSHADTEILWLKSRIYSQLHQYSLIDDDRVAVCHAVYHCIEWSYQ